MYGDNEVSNFDISYRNRLPPRPGPTLALWFTGGPPACPAAESAKKDKRAPEKSVQISKKSIWHLSNISITAEYDTVYGTFLNGSDFKRCRTDGTVRGTELKGVHITKRSRVRFGKERYTV